MGDNTLEIELDSSRLASLEWGLLGRRSELGQLLERVQAIGEAQGLDQVGNLVRARLGKVNQILRVLSRRRTLIIRGALVDAETHQTTAAQVGDGDVWTDPIPLEVLQDLVVVPAKLPYNDIFITTLLQTGEIHLRI